jgi:plasmid stabilization system protein ParE
MRFTVTWHPSAEQELAEIWLQASDQGAISTAANAIDQLLAVNPAMQGEEFYGDRLLVVLPLAVTFTASEPDRTVRILQVWHQ